VLTLIAQGATANAAGHRLSCSPRTVHKHTEAIYRKPHVRDRVSAVRVAAALGLLPDSGCQPQPSTLANPEIGRSPSDCARQAEFPPSVCVEPGVGAEPPTMNGESGLPHVADQSSVFQVAHLSSPRYSVPSPIEGRDSLPTRTGPPCCARSTHRLSQAELWITRIRLARDRQDGYNSGPSQQSYAVSAGHPRGQASTAT
jgi:hypothetical protein